MAEDAKGAEITWGQTFRVWWAFVWRLALLGGLGGGLLAGIIGVMFAVVIGVSVANIVAKVSFAGALLAASLLVVRGLMSADFGDFSIRLVPGDEGRAP